MIIKLIEVTIVLALASCSTVQQALDPNVEYRKDISIVANGYKGEGVLVVPQASKYDFEFELAGKADLFTFTTCHRQEIKEAAGNKGIFGDKKKVKASYTPVKGLEDKGSCIVDIGGFEIKGQNSWGLIDFQTSEHILPATIRCNGNEYQSSGVSVCQSKFGLIQEIEFAFEVFASPAANCPLLPSKDNKKFQYVMSKGKCLFLFQEKTSNRLHKLTTVGYQNILIREF